jgi:hypothetical protein
MARRKWRPHGVTWNIWLHDFPYYYIWQGRFWNIYKAYMYGFVIELRWVFTEGSNSCCALVDTRSSCGQAGARNIARAADSHPMWRAPPAWFWCIIICHANMLRAKFAYDVRHVACPRVFCPPPPATPSYAPHTRVLPWNFATSGARALHN